MRRSIYTVIGVVLLFAAIKVYACGDGSACVKKTDVKKSASIDKTGKVMANVNINSNGRINKPNPKVTLVNDRNLPYKISNSSKPFPGMIMPIFRAVDPAAIPIIFAQRGNEFQAETAVADPWSWRILGDLVEK